MPYVETINRHQVQMMSMDIMVDPGSIVRIIDAFVDSLNLKEMGMTKTKAAEEGRPLYPANSLLKLYLYGYRHQIRSSRKLDQACKVNLEVIWLMEGMRPDFRTIADFRKDNAEVMKKVFLEFNKR